MNLQFDHYFRIYENLLGRVCPPLSRVSLLLARLLLSNIYCLGGASNLTSLQLQGGPTEANQSQVRNRHPSDPQKEALIYDREAKSRKEEASRQGL